MTQAPPVDRARVVRAATLLFGARRSNSKLPSLPADARPASAAEAFAIQEEVTRLEGLPIGGWKVGLDPGVRFSFAPIYVPAVRESPAIIRSAGVSSLIIEAEVAFHLAADLPVRDVPYTAAEVA
ncbi:MAG TPA: hypothetical protein VFV80_13410, partial [Geminicoccaceae bacterium]|nr:hypothetical protein [Geminicoccaceae bacterium]